MKLIKRAAVSVIVLVSYILPFSIGVETNREINNMDESVEGVCRDYPERIKSLFGNLNLDTKDFESVKLSVEQSNDIEACNALLRYYRDVGIDKFQLPPGVPITDKVCLQVEEILRDTFTFYSVKATVPRNQIGGLDWQYKGPSNDPEWAMALNRLYPLCDLLKVYKSNLDKRIVRYFNTVVRDWIISNPYPNRKSNDTVMWRGLETFSRLKTWADGFYTFHPARINLSHPSPDPEQYSRTCRLPTSVSWWG